MRPRLHVNVKEEISKLSAYLGPHVHPQPSEFSEIMTPATIYWAYPDVISPAPHVYRMVGEEKIREVVQRHHELLIASPLREIFGDNEKRYQIIVERTADFHVEACGGPSYYREKRGAGHLGMRHLPFTITEDDRELWLDLYARAIIETGFPLDAGEIYWRWLESVSLRVINRRGRALPPARVSFAQALAPYRKAAL